MVSISERLHCSSCQVLADLKHKILMQYLPMRVNVKKPHLRCFYAEIVNGALKVKTEWEWVTLGLEKNNLTMSSGTQMMQADIQAVLQLLWIPSRQLLMLSWGMFSWFSLDVISVVCMAPLCLNVVTTASQHAPDEIWMDFPTWISASVSSRIICGESWWPMQAATMANRRPGNSISVFIIQ